MTVLNTYNKWKKDAPYIASLFETHLLVLDPHKTLVDLFFFDGASNI